MDAAESLAALGLEGKQASVYVFVHAHGIVRPVDVSNGLGIGRTDAYRILDELTFRGFIVQTLNKNARYEAVPLARLFDREIAKASARQSELVEAREGGIRAFGALTRKQTLKPTTVTQNVYGRRECVARMLQMLRDARETWHSITTHPGTFRMGAEEMGLRTIYRERAQEGLDIRSIVTINDRNLAYFRTLADLPNVTMHHLATEAPLLCAFSDHSELLLWIALGDHADVDSPPDVAFFTNAPGAVRSHEILFEALCEQAHPLEPILEAGTARHAKPFPDPTDCSS